jgi:hypothetical protein
MPEQVKIELINVMARAPAEWCPAATLAKTESKISTNRNEYKKNPVKKRKVITHDCKCPLAGCFTKPVTKIGTARRRALFPSV